MIMIMITTTTKSPTIDKMDKNIYSITILITKILK